MDDRINDLDNEARNLKNFLYEIHSDLSLQGNQKLIMNKIESVLILPPKKNPHN